MQITCITFVNPWSMFDQVKPIPMIGSPGGPGGKFFGLLEAMPILSNQIRMAMQPMAVAEPRGLSGNDHITFPSMLGIMESVGGFNRSKAISRRDLSWKVWVRVPCLFQSAMFDYHRSRARPYA